MVFLHGVAAASFSALFLLLGLGIYVPFLSSFLGPAEEYTSVSCLWISVAIGTFSAYEILFLPYLPGEMQGKLKVIFAAYHIPWALIITYVALLPAANWTVWGSAAVMLRGGSVPWSSEI